MTNQVTIKVPHWGIRHKEHGYWLGNTLNGVFWTTSRAVAVAQLERSLVGAEWEVAEFEPTTVVVVEATATPTQTQGQ